MKTPPRTGAVGALLDEYEKALAELKGVIGLVTDAELSTIAEAKTTDHNCKSIQTVMAHVVRAGYTYAIMIEGIKGEKLPFRDRIYREQVADFIQDLDDMFAYNLKVLDGVQDQELENHDAAQKMISSWGQLYDIEQLLEHAIVHILRHRRQIERFLAIIKGT